MNADEGDGVSVLVGVSERSRAVEVRGVVSWFDVVVEFACVFVVRLFLFWCSCCCLLLTKCVFLARRWYHTIPSPRVISFLSFWESHLINEDSPRCSAPPPARYYGSTNITACLRASLSI